MNKEFKALIVALAALVLGIIIMVYALPIEAYTGTVEYAELTATGATSTTGNAYQGDVLVCVWNTTGASAFSGTVKVQIYHTLGSGGAKGEWVDTGDIFTTEGCKILSVPENGVKMRGYFTKTSGSVRVRISQEYPTKVNNVGR